MIKKKLLNFLCGALLLAPAFHVVHAQNLNLGWAYQLGGEGIDRGQETVSNVRMNDQGDVYISGFFSGTIDIDPGPGTHYLTSIAPDRSSNFIAKFDRTGLLQWATQLDDGGVNIAMEIDKEGNLYLAGNYTDTVDFDPGPDTFALHAQPGGTMPAYILKLDKNGNFVWVKSYGETKAATNGIIGYYYDFFRLALDNENNIILAFGMYGTVDLNPGAAAADTFYITAENKALALVKLDNAGTFIWGKKLFGNATVQALAIDKQNNILLGGAAEAAVQFHTGPAFTPGYQDAYVCRYSSSGIFQWVKILEGDVATVPYSRSYLNALAVTADDEILIAGESAGAVDLNPGTVKDTVNTGDGNLFQGFLIKLNNTGEFIWRARQGGNAIALDKRGNIYLGGANAVSPAEKDKTRFKKLDNKGALVWEKENITKGISGYGMLFSGMAVDTAGKVLVNVGRFGAYWDYGRGATSDFDPGPDSFNMSTQGDFDGFVQYLTCNTYGADTIVACNEVVYNGRTYKESGLYFVPITGAATSGCDSIVRLHLTIDSVDLGVTSSGATLTANLPGVSYQWINCADNSPIAGATDKTFLAEANGNYAVIITTICGSDTSDCVSVQVASIVSPGDTEMNLLSLYPNPAKDYFVIDNYRELTIENVQLINVLGQTVAQYPVPGRHNTQRFALNSLAKGIYTVRVRTVEKGTVVSRLSIR